MFSHYLLQAAGTEGEMAGGGAVLMIAQLLPLVLVFVVFYFMLIRPQKKRDKEVQKMRSSLEVGDEIVTSGGIIGRVVSLKEDTIVIETGSDRSKLRIARWAVQSNILGTTSPSKQQLSPTGTATRAQCASILMRFSSLQGLPTATPDPDEAEAPEANENGQVTDTGSISDTGLPSDDELLPDSPENLDPDVFSAP